MRAFRRLLRDNDDTVQAFEIMKALNGRSTRWGYQRLLRTREGGAIAFRQLELAAMLDEMASRRVGASGSVGAAYVGFVRSERLTARGLAKISEALPDLRIAQEHPYAWYGRRVRDVHDVWHVLTGYGREPLGELCLAAFSYAQTGQRGWAFIAVAGAVQALRGPRGLSAAAAILEAWRNGRRAAWLMGEDYPPLLDEPMGSARARLKILPAPRYESLGARANVVTFRSPKPAIAPPGGQSLARSE